MPLSAFSFMVHQGANRAEVLEGFLDDVRSKQTGWRVGINVGLPRYLTNTGIARLSDLATRASYSLADPETHRREWPLDKRGIGRREFAWLRASSPGADLPGLVRGVIDAQVAANPSAIISPWLTHGVGTPAGRHLEATRECAGLASVDAAAQGRTLFIGACVTEAVIRDASERDYFLDELVDLPDGAIYLRLLEATGRAYTGYADEEVLTGLRAVGEALQANGRQLLLPQTGLLGWLMMPFGCVSFGAGRASTQQQTAAPRGGGPSSLERYFFPQLLSYVFRQELPALQALSGHVECTCPYCGSLPLTGRGAWDEVNAGKHFLWWCARLANEFNQPGVGAHARLQARLAAAQAVLTQAQEAQVVFDPRTSPRHLAVWSRATA